MPERNVLTKDLPVMVCDGHILEPQDIWTEDVEPEFRDIVRRRGLWKEDRAEGGWTIYLDGDVQQEIPGPVAFFGAVLHPGLDKEALGRVRMNVDPFPLAPGAADARARLHDMDLMGIDQAMLLPTYCGMTFTSIADPAAALGLARAYNSWIADFCAPDSTRLFPAGIIPQHDNEDAVSEVRRIAGLGFRCVIIRPNIIGGRYPAHESFDPVWEAIQEAGIVAAIHPFPATGPADCTGWLIDELALASGLRRGMISESVCFASDAQSFLMMAFHTDLYSKFPRLKLAVLESNASWLPYVLSKADGRVKAFTASRGTTIKAVPSEAFYRQSWIAFESDEETVFETWRRFEDIGVWASDYPHFDGEDAWEAIEHMTKWGVPRDAQAKMLGANAYKMYDIEPKLVVTEQLPLPEVPLPV